MKTILCYGDSLTWGFIPGTMGKRYGPEVRWPKLVQGLLGSDYEIIEEALNGRTTVWEDSFREGRHGARLLQPLLESHGPLDLVIIMLGSNDLLHYRDVLACGCSARYGQSARYRGAHHHGMSGAASCGPSDFAPGRGEAHSRDGNSLPG